MLTHTLSASDLQGESLPAFLGITVARCWVVDDGVNHENISAPGMEAPCCEEKERAAVVVYQLRKLIRCGELEREFPVSVDIPDVG